MAPHHARMAEPDPISQLPRNTTPTWEVELLISGVAVFAMLQLPGWLDDRYFALLPRFGSGWEVPLLLTYAYLKSATVILAISFALHLLLRAQWIAQVGMHSVFPEGIRWDRLRIGPVQRRLEEARYGSAGAAIERADNRATVVFAIGVMLASSLLLICALLIAIFLAASWLLASAGVDADPGKVFMYSALLMILPVMLASWLDLRFGAKLGAGGLAQRLLAWILSAYGRLGMLSRGSNPVFSLLSSHGGERRAMLLTTTVVILTIGGVLMSMRSMRNPDAFGDYEAFPAFAEGKRTLDAAHYDDQRDPARDDPLAFVQSVVVAGPYLRLTVPYRPDRDAAALRGCAIPAVANDDSRAAAKLACLQAAHAVLLDGKPLAALQYELGSDPRTDRPALLAMIDVRGLAPGRHELRVAHPPGTDKDKDKDKDPGFVRIPFWK